MQKWEYLFLTAEIEQNNWRPRYINGQELRDWKKGPDISLFANQMGEQGWELIAAPYTAYAASYTGATNQLSYKLMFKRSRT